ncbi:MAG TPA: ABC transporter ATP-binding protein, partial [Bacilli bacterium]|nr:ABC transporter ATP-binding protein [Bacilli bacterium]
MARSEKPMILELNDVKIKYGPIQAVKGINLSVHE